jgi:hypothetical protein
MFGVGQTTTTTTTTTTTAANTARAPAQAEEGYYYRDQSGKEKGPFDYASMQSWFSAGYFKSDLKVCKGRGGKVRNIGQMLVQDAHLHGVPSHMVQSVIAPKYGLAENPSTKFGGVASVGDAGGRESREQRYASYANQPTSLSVENVTECVTRVIETLTEILPLVLEGGLRAEFGDEMWADMTSTPPPWSFEQSARELKSHWNSIFSSMPRRNKEFEILMDCLYRKRKEGMYCLHVGEARALAEAAMQIIEGCPKDFPEAVNARLAQAWAVVEEVREVLKR